MSNHFGRQKRAFSLFEIIAEKFIIIIRQAGMLSEPDRWGIIICEYQQFENDPKLTGFVLFYIRFFFDKSEVAF